jgi:hypothetical protein
LLHLEICPNWLQLKINRTDLLINFLHYYINVFLSSFFTTVNISESIKKLKLCFDYGDVKEILQEFELKAIRVAIYIIYRKAKKLKTELTIWSNDGIFLDLMREQALSVIYCICKILIREKIRIDLNILLQSTYVPYWLKKQLIVHCHLDPHPIWILSSEIYKPRNNK